MSAPRLLRTSLPPVGRSALTVSRYEEAEHSGTVRGGDSSVGHRSNELIKTSERFFREPQCDQMAVAFHHCSASFSNLRVTPSLTSVCLGTGKSRPVLGFLYTSWSPPSRTKTAPWSARIFSSSRRLIGDASAEVPNRSVVWPRDLEEFGRRHSRTTRNSEGSELGSDLARCKHRTATSNRSSPTTHLHPERFGFEAGGPQDPDRVPIASCQCITRSISRIDEDQRGSWGDARREAAGTRRAAAGSDPERMRGSRKDASRGAGGHERA